MIDTIQISEIIVSKSAEEIMNCFDVQWPDGCECAAVDENGELWFYANNPKKGGDCYMAKSGKAVQVKLFCHDWQNSVIYRGIE